MNKDNVINSVNDLYKENNKKKIISYVCSSKYLSYIVIKELK